MVSFNPYNTFSTDSTCALMITGKNCFQYAKLKDYHNLEVKQKNVARKDVLSLNNTYFTCHTFVCNCLLVCTERGDILFCDKDGDFKSKLIESPGNNYFISSIVPIKGEDFIISNPDGYMNFYTATKELKNPFKLEKDRLPEIVDREDNKFVDYIE